MGTARGQSAWLALAIASGACAAFNGVFAKLTTTTLTTTWAHAISSAFNLNPSNKPVEFLIRSFFFALNLLFNTVMWGLFTRALTLASSTVRVSVINTSANFMITAVLGAAIFSEALPGLWWLGATLLIAGSVVIGAREEGSGKSGDGVGVGVGGTEGLGDVALGEEEEDSKSRQRFRDDPVETDDGDEMDARSSHELRSVDDAPELR